MTADDVLIETVDRLLRATCTFEAVEQAEVDGWCTPVWDALAGAGFPWVSVPEAAGGSGGSLTDAMAVLREVGRHAAPVPVAETMLAGWLLAAAGVAMPEGPLSVLWEPIDLDRRATAPWGRRAERIVGVLHDKDDWRVVVAERGQFDVVVGNNLAGEPRDEIRITAPRDALTVVAAPDGVDRMALQQRGALTRVVMAAGALEAMTQLTVDYAHDRRQFGKPIASFQAVQAHLVQAAQATASMSMAADVAVRALETGDARVEIAAARALLDDAVTGATRAAHQAHGAMGVTREYPLHHFTRRLWSWRDEYGSGRWWREWLGLELAAGGPHELFSTITR